MRLRSPTPDDARDVLDLIVARDIADLGRPDYTLEDVENDWASPQTDLKRDAWLAVDDAGTPLGYALLDDRGAALITVPPSSEGRGVGTALREAAETRALERGEALCRQFIPSGNERARALLLDAGYWPAYSYFRLARDLTDLPPAPAEVAVRQFSRGIDDVAVHALIDEAFASIPGNMAQTLESWQAAKIDRQGWDPSLWLVHEDANGLAGIVLCERWEEDTGYIDFLAVAPRVQGQGLGRAMLLHGLHALEDGGLARAELSVQGENASAISLYESVGMRSVATTERWEKPLRAM